MWENVEGSGLHLAPGSRARLVSSGLERWGMPQKPGFWPTPSLSPTTWLLKSNYRAERAYVMHIITITNVQIRMRWQKYISTCIFYASFPVAGCPFYGSPKLWESSWLHINLLEFLFSYWVFGGRKVHGGHTKCAFNWQIPKGHRISINGTS